MKVLDTPLQGLKLLELRVFEDERGFFTEKFNQKTFAEAGSQTQFVQDNHSRSLPGVVRGLHFQINPSQEKLVGVIRGKIWDVAVDIRKGSPTFGKHFAVELSDQNGLMLWIPTGFAHGFCVTGDEPADVLYKVSGFYSPTGEKGILWSDQDLNIPWPLNGQSPIVSARDRTLPDFRHYRDNPHF